MEYLQQNKFKERPNFGPIYQVSFFFFCWAMHHVSIYFLGRAVFRSLPGEKRSCFREKIPAFQIIQERPCAGVAPFGKAIFSEGLKKISYFREFLKERSSFIFRLTRKIIFSGKRSIIFPDNTRKIIFQHNLFGKTFFSGRLEKENMVFRVVIPNKE